MTPLIADADGILTLTVSAQAIGIWVATGLTSFSGGVFFLLRWFLAQVDKKDKEHEDDLKSFGTKLMAEVSVLAKDFRDSIREERERSERAEQRSLGVHDKTIGVVEAVKGSLDALAGRVSQLESRIPPLLPPRRRADQPPPGG